MSTGASAGQTLALEQLAAIAKEGTALEILSQKIEMSVLSVDVSIDCSGTKVAPGGLPLRSRERFTLAIAADFPFSVPTVETRHRRWAEYPHVQWGLHLCLYAAPDVEWIPADGMHGLLQRLSLWLTEAAQGNLDPDDRPLHPPVAYADSTYGRVVVRANVGDFAPKPAVRTRSGLPRATKTAETDGSFEFAVALFATKPDGRMDIIEWVSLEEFKARCHSGMLAGDFLRLRGALAVLADREATFEYPRTLLHLREKFKVIGLDWVDFLFALAIVSLRNRILDFEQQSAGYAPQLVLWGTPSRGQAQDRKQHLVCWRLSDEGRAAVEELPHGLPDEAGAEQVAAAWADYGAWLTSTVRWVQVDEARPEVTQRRDAGSVAEWLRGKRVLLLGAGALGAPIAEHVVRAGAARLDIYDRGVVSPGILVRQPYADSDIGYGKAATLAVRLRGLQLGAHVEGFGAAAASALTASGLAALNFDLVIDATADSSTRSCVERYRSAIRDQAAPLMTLLVGHDAQRGVVAVSRCGSTGAGADVLRRLALAARQSQATRLSDVADDFFPREPRTDLLQPEPGCSSPTYAGGALDMAVLAAGLLEAGVAALSGEEPDADAPMAAAVVRQRGGARCTGRPPRPGVEWVSWPNDEVFVDATSQLEVRLSTPAAAEIRAEVRRGARVRPADFETGGMLMGGVDEASGCLWVDVAAGPPPDSLLSPLRFDHGVVGTRAYIDHHLKASGELTSLVGYWHTHPGGPARPSPTDEAGMSGLITPVPDGPRRALMMILGGEGPIWTRWLSGQGRPNVYARYITAPTGQPMPTASPLHHSLAVLGGFRVAPKAIAPRRRALWRRVFTR